MGMRLLLGVAAAVAILMGVFGVTKHPQRSRRTQAPASGAVHHPVRPITLGDGHAPVRRSPVSTPPAGQED